jgi:hypothetical protein
MSENFEILLGVGLLIGVIFLTRRFHAWRLRQGYRTIVDDLKAQEAYDEQTAVRLEYMQKSLLRMGVRDHRPTAMQHLTLENIVGVTADGRYFLKDRSL